MTTDQAIAFLLFAVVAAATPGPSNIILTAVGANAGVLKGLPSLLGVTVGMGLMCSPTSAISRGVEGTACWRKVNEDE